MDNRNVFWIFILLLDSVQMLSQPVYEVDTSYPVHSLDKYLMVWEDTTKDFSLDSLQARADLHFQPWERFDQLLHSSSAYWVKVSLTSQTGLSDWILQFERQYPYTTGWSRGNGKIDVFGFRKNEMLFHKKSGADYRKSEKEIKERWNLGRVRIDLSKNDTIQLITRIEGTSFGFPPIINFTLCQKDFENHEWAASSRSFMIRFMLGAVFILLIYHFSLFLYLRRKVYGLFSLWLFTSFLSLSMVVDLGIPNEFIIGNYPGIRFSLWMLCSNLIWITFWFFGRAFIDTRKRYPVFDKWILGIAGFLLLEMVINLSMISIKKLGLTSPEMGFHFLFLSICTFFGFFLALALAIRKDALARYFGIGAMIATLSTILGGVWQQGLINLSFDPFVWGIFLQIIAYSFGLAYRSQLQAQAFKRAQLELLEAEKSKIEIQHIKDLNELKSRFFANVSHEFRTPLTLILGMLNRFDPGDKTETEEALIPKKSIDIIRRNATRLQNLVEQLLDLSKVESGHVHLHLKCDALVQFVRTIVLDFESIARQKNIHFNTIFPAEPAGAYFDEDKLGKIVSNLLSNAFKFTPQGGTVGFRMQVEGDFIILEVSDTGRGIHPDEVDKIFDRFYRIEGNEAKGSGIGLALTRELVGLHQGQIKVDSVEGSGTKFIVRLPYTLDRLPSSVKAPVNGSIMNQGQNGSLLPAEEKEEIEQSEQPVALIVEDHEELRVFISQILSPEYQVLMAEDGEQAEKIAIDRLPNIIISDVMMPRRDGYELTHRLKSNIKTSHIPVILLTAKAGQENKMSGLRQGADAYMTKPFSEDELLIRMKNLIQAREEIWKQFQHLGSAVVSGLKLSSMDDRFFQQVQTVIKDHLSDEFFSVDDLARAVGFSRSQLHRKLKALVDKSPNQLIREMRLQRAKVLLDAKTGNISEIAYEVGYSNLSYFSKSFKEFFGETPSKLLEK